MLDDCEATWRCSRSLITKSGTAEGCNQNSVQEMLPPLPLLQSQQIALIAFRFFDLLSSIALQFAKCCLCQGWYPRSCLGILVAQCPPNNGQDSWLGQEKGKLNGFAEELQ